MQTPGITIFLAILALLVAVACSMHLQFARRPSRIAFAGFGMGMGVAIVALGAAVV